MTSTDALADSIGRKRPHWYRLHVGECPVCGKDASFRERVYGPRPEKRQERVVELSYQETYDHCLEYEASR